MSLPNIIESIIYRDSATEADIAKVLRVCSASRKSDSQARLVVSCITECLENGSKVDPDYAYNALVLLEVLVKNVGRVGQYASSDVICSLLERVAKLQARADGAAPQTTVESGHSYQSLSTDDLDGGEASRSPEWKAMKLIALWGTLHPDEFAPYAAAIEKWTKAGIAFPPVVESDIFPLPGDFTSQQEQSGSSSSSSSSSAPVVSPQPSSKKSDEPASNAPKSSSPSRKKRVAEPAYMPSLAMKMEMQSVSKAFITVEKFTKLIEGYTNSLFSMCAAETIDPDILDRLVSKCCECIPKLDYYIRTITNRRDPFVREMSTYEKETSLRYLFQAKDKIEEASMLVEKTKRELREAAVAAAGNDETDDPPPPYSDSDDDGKDENPWDIKKQQVVSSNQPGNYLEKLLEGDGAIN